MKSLHKKVGIIILSGALLIGAPLSNGLIAYANSPNRIIDISREVRSFNNIFSSNNNDNDKLVYSIYSNMGDIMGAQKIYNYKILKINPSQDYIDNAIKLGKDFESDKNLGKIKKYKINLNNNIILSAQNSKDFLQYLKYVGMPEGIYRVIIRDRDYILKFYQDVPRGVDWLDHFNKWVYSDSFDIGIVLGFQKIHNYNVLKVNPNEKFLQNFSKSHGKINSIRKFKNGYDFIDYFINNRFRLKGLYRIDIRKQKILIEFKGV